MVENTGTTHLPCKATVRSDLVEHATLLCDISYPLCPRGSRKYWYPTHKCPWEGTGDSEAGGFVEPQCNFPKIRAGAGCNSP